MEDRCWFVRLVETLCRCVRCVSVEAWGWLVGNFVCGLLILPSSFGLALGAMLNWRRGRRGCSRLARSNNVVWSNSVFRFVPCRQTL
jgi:hypothetical protein